MIFNPINADVKICSLVGVPVRQVRLLAACIENDEELVTTTLRDDAVILDPSRLQHDETKSGLARCKCLCVHNSDFLQELRCISSLDSDLAHVRNIEKSATRPAV